jgi:hypothetical protein
VQAGSSSGAVKFSAAGRRRRSGGADGRRAGVEERQAGSEKGSLWLQAAVQARAEGRRSGGLAVWRPGADWIYLSVGGDAARRTPLTSQPSPARPIKRGACGLQPAVAAAVTLRDRACARGGARGSALSSPCSTARRRALILLRKRRECPRAPQQCSCVRAFPNKPAPTRSLPPRQ